MLQPYKGHLQGVYLTHSSSKLNKMSHQKHNSAFFMFRRVNFVLCLGITNKYINSYQFIISLCCCYVFRQLCAILRELVCTFLVTCLFGFLVDKILYGMWLCVVVYRLSRYRRAPWRWNTVAETCRSSKWNN
jgi:hypothetical protein